MIPVLAAALLSLIMISTALAAVYTKDLVSAVVLSGAVSLTASILYLVLASPDVAMTEAAIGSGLTTVIFLYSIARIKKQGISFRC